MKHVLLKLAVIAVAASALSGCIVYVSPDKDVHTHRSHPVDEKPADTMSHT